MVVVALLAGTAAAFAVTQNEKTRLVPIFRTQVTQDFSPVCRCETARAAIDFALRRSGALELDVRSGDTVVRALVAGRRFGRGRKHFSWNGRDDAGRVVADGVYAPHVRFEGKEYALPNAIRVDTVPPRIAASLRGRVLRYVLSEPAHVLVDAGGRRVVRGRWQRLRASLLLPAGVGAVTVRAQDLAGNLSRPVSPE